MPPRSSATSAISPTSSPSSRSTNASHPRPPRPASYSAAAECQLSTQSCRDNSRPIADIPGSVDRSTSTGRDSDRGDYLDQGTAISDNGQGYLRVGTMHRIFFLVAPIAALAGGSGAAAQTSA